MPEGLNEDDKELLKTIRGTRVKKKKPEEVLNNRFVTEEALDEVFLEE